MLPADDAQTAIAKMMSLQHLSQAVARTLGTNVDEIQREQILQTARERYQARIEPILQDFQAIVGALSVGRV